MAEDKMSKSNTPYGKAKQIEGAGEAIGGILEELSQQNAQLQADVVVANEAIAFWTTVLCAVLMKHGHRDAETQFILTPEMINEVTGAELGYTNNNRGDKTKHFMFVTLKSELQEFEARTKVRPTGQEMVDAGKKQSTSTGSGGRIVSVDGKPFSN